jgi:hypothetical protein
MFRLRQPAAITIAILLSTISVAQSRRAHPDTAADDSTLVFGDGFVFSVKEPDGWHCICGQAASEYQVNAVFFPTSAQSRAHHVAIRVRVNQKSDENTLEDLKADMRQYKRRYPKVQFAVLDVAHAEYRTYTKLFAFPNDFYDYVGYVNPGPNSTFTLSVAMSKGKILATQEELAAYAKVLRSLHVFTGKPPLTH